MQKDFMKKFMFLSLHVATKWIVLCFCILFASEIRLAIWNGNFILEEGVVRNNNMCIFQ